jgi:hypothetical protein
MHGKGDGRIHGERQHRSDLCPAGLDSRTINECDGIGGGRVVVCVCGGGEGGRSVQYNPYGVGARCLHDTGFAYALL